jgi:hypothetical protein
MSDDEETRTFREQAIRRTRSGIGAAQLPSASGGVTPLQLPQVFIHCDVAS